MFHFLALILALVTPVQAAEAFDSVLERELYYGELVQLEGTPGGDHQLVNGNNKRVTPGAFAMRLGDDALAARYQKSYKLNQTAGIMLWSYGGASLVGGFYIAYGGLLGWALTGNAAFGLFGIAGLTFMASGAVALPMGFVMFFNGKKRLNDPRTWWNAVELDHLIEEYNDDLGAQYGQQGRRIEIRPVLAPNALALNVRF
ncbi:MAG: hypothetical protein GY913_05365 [Proteobacteria bacterium]|nr:hypothetical protein [Pseudomonadota bacterium]MCP4916331.1 hypothetical protein [Pseudomonadota bacterium]